MTQLRLGPVEARFADIIWREEPVTSRELVRLCGLELSWKPTTTYTVLKRLCERGIFQNEHSLVISLISREEFYGRQGEILVDQAFDGSLPAFIAAFTSRKPLTPEEAAAIRRVIDDHPSDCPKTFQECHSEQSEES